MKFEFEFECAYMCVCERERESACAYKVEGVDDGVPGGVAHSQPVGGQVEFGHQGRSTQIFIT